MIFRHIFIHGVLVAYSLVFCPLSLHAEIFSTTADTVSSFIPETIAISQPSPDEKEKPAAHSITYTGTSEYERQDTEYDESNNGIETTEEESPSISDPIAPLNKVMFHVNDKLYFWMLKPVTQGYVFIIPEDFRVVFSNAYDNLKAPGRAINNLLQFRLLAAGDELIRFLFNSTIGIGGLSDVAGALGIKKQEADFGQTLGHYGIGHGFYIVWPVLGPSSLRDTVGFVGDRLMYPLTYISGSNLPLEATVGISAHEKVNDTSFKIGDYESFKKAAVDPYTAMRDSFVQYRKKKIEQSDPLFKGRY